MRILETSDILDICLAFLLSWSSSSTKGNNSDPPKYTTFHHMQHWYFKPSCCSRYRHNPAAAIRNMIYVDTIREGQKKRHTTKLGEAIIKNIPEFCEILL